MTAPDIVDRLRALSSQGDPTIENEAADRIVLLEGQLAEAADEIDRLRAEIGHLREIIHAGADEIEKLRIAAAVDRAWLKSVEVVDTAAADETSDRLIDAIAECIVARQGLPNRDRAKAVLAEIEAQGWRLLPPKEEP